MFLALRPQDCSKLAQDEYATAGHSPPPPLFYAPLPDPAAAPPPRPDATAVSDLIDSTKRDVHFGRVDVDFGRRTRRHLETCKKIN